MFRPRAANAPRIGHVPCPRNYILAKGSRSTLRSYPFDTISTYLDTSGEAYAEARASDALDPVWTVAVMRLMLAHTAQHVFLAKRPITLRVKETSGTRQPSRR